MEITLIKSVNGNEIHGTENNKKTGCGINLTKPENIGRYIPNGVMTDLIDMNCEKCREVLAKKMIKADKKERARILREEKMLEKRGIIDENIVPLGGTSAKITGSSENSLNYSSPAQTYQKRTAASVSAPINTVNSVNTPISPTSNNNSAQHDDIMSQFAIPSPNAQQPVHTPSNSEKADDVLSQFAIPSPNKAVNDTPPETSKPIASNIDEALAQFAIPVPQMNNFKVESNIQKPAPQDNTSVDMDDTLAQFAIPSPTTNTASINTVPNSNYIDNDIEVIGETPKETTHYNDDEVVDIDEMTHINGKPVSDISVKEISDTIEDDLAEIKNQWEAFASDFFSGNDYTETENTSTVSNVNDEIQSADNLSASEISENNELNSQYDEPAHDEINPTLSGFDSVDSEIAEPEVAEEIPEEVIEEPTISEIDNISETYENSEPVINEIPKTNSNQYHYTSPFEETEQQTQAADIHRYTAPVFPDEVNTSPMEEIKIPNTFNNENTVNTAQNIPNIPVQPVMPQQQFAAIPQLVGYDPNGQPLYAYVQQPIVGYDQNGQPIFAPIQPMQQITPVQQISPMPNAVPIQPIVQNTVPPVQNIAPMQSIEPVQQTVQNTVPPVQNIAPMQSIEPVQQTVQNTVPPVQNTAPMQSIEPVQQTVQNTVPPVQNIAPMQSIEPVQPTENLQNADFTRTAHTSGNVQMPQTEEIQIPQTIEQAVEAMQNGTPMRSNITELHPEQIHLSTVEDNNKQIPDSVASAMAKSREKQKTNIFDMQGIEMPVIDSIEDALSQMGGNVKKKEQTMQDTVVPIFEEYKAPPKNPPRTLPKENKEKEPERPLTKAEIKRRKKQDKIDAKFKKDLAKRGF
ncbi:MAG: hypothetical protein PUE69_07810 [Ruminococcus sp.]|nr:hypothetical protein [Ruminococcus sp.]